MSEAKEMDLKKKIRGIAHRIHEEYVKPTSGLTVMSEVTLTKVTMEFSDGKVQSLEGDEAERWLKECNAKIQMEFIHGRSFPEFNWNRRTASGSPKVPLSLGYKDCCKKAIEEYMENNPVTLPVELDNQAIRAIIYMQLDHEDTYSDLLLIENQSAKNCFNAISKMCADEICSRFSQKKVTKEEILRVMQFQRRPENGNERLESLFAQAILDLIEGKTK
jgi:hypothetical protein